MCLKALITRNSQVLSRWNHICAAVMFLHIHASHRTATLQTYDDLIDHDALLWMKLASSIWIYTKHINHTIYYINKHSNELKLSNKHMNAAGSWIQRHEREKHWQQHLNVSTWRTFYSLNSQSFTSDSESSSVSVISIRIGLDSSSEPETNLNSQQISSPLFVQLLQVVITQSSICTTNHSCFGQGSIQEVMRQHDGSRLCPRRCTQTRWSSVWTLCSAHCRHRGWGAGGRKKSQTVIEFCPSNPIWSFPSNTC